MIGSDLVGDSASIIHPSRQDLEAIQLERLNALLAEVSESNPFYRSKLSALRLPLASLAAFQETVPFTTKEEWVADQEQNPPYGTNLTYPLTRYTRCHQTSGTSGKPMRWLDTTSSWDGIVDDWVEVMRAAGLEQADRFFFAFSFGPFLGFWSAFEAALKMGSFSLSGGGMTTETRLQVLVKNQITVLGCTPTYAIRLGEAARERGVETEGLPLRRLLVAGEPGGSLPAVRDRLKQLWPGASVFDHHGMTETGPVSYECPEMPGRLHLNETSYLAEVVDREGGLAVQPGTRGELVLTTLRRLGSPLIRYRTGDLVELAARQPCVCGRYHLALEGGIIGRVDDMVVIRGVNVFPSAIDEIVRRCGGVIEYQAIVSERRSLAELELAIEVEAGEKGDEPVRRRLEEELRKSLALRIPVRVVSQGLLPRFEMKAKRWVRVDQE